MDKSNEKQQEPVRAFTRLLNVLGVYNKDQIPKSDPQAEAVNNKAESVVLYRTNELRHFQGMQKETNSPTNVGNLESFTRSASQPVTDRVRELDELVLLNPEIKSATNALVSCILSPTDLKSDEIEVVVENTDLGDTVETEISDFLHTFFNTKFNLNDKLTQWITKALIKEGAAAILTLPPENINILNKAMDLERKGDPTYNPKRKLTLGIENLTQEMSGCETLETVLTNNDSIEELIKDISFESIDVLESLCESIQKNDDENSKFQYENGRESFTKNTSQFIKETVNKKINFYSNPGLIAVHNNHTHMNIQKIEDKITDHLIGAKTNSRPMFVLSENPSDYSSKIASAIDLPMDSVIPVIVPNNPNNHIGYFVLVDKWGSPVSNIIRSTSNVTPSQRLVQNAMMTTRNVFFSNGFGNSRNTETDRFRAATQVFSIALKNILKNKLHADGLTEATVERNDAIANCVFYNLLLDKNVGIIFVPESLMTYYRYDIHPDGTGKSILEDIRTILALRGVLLVAQIMGTLENAIDNKLVTINVEKATNPEQMLDFVRNLMIEKRIVPLEHNPNSIQKNIVQRSTVIVPKGLRGLENSLELTSDRKSTGATLPDTALYELLTNHVATGLETPHSLFNATSENEYARSVATTNLLFANKIGKCQKTTVKYTKDLLKSMIKFSSILRDGITDILKKSCKLEPVKGSTEDISNADTIKTNDDTLMKSLMKVIDGVTIKLPSPNIIKSKAQFEEIKAFADSINSVVDAKYPEAMSAGTKGYSDIRNALVAIQKSKAISEYIKSVGLQSLFDLPDFSDLDEESIHDFVMKCANVKKGVHNCVKHLTGGKPSDDDDYSSNSDDMGSDTGESNPSDLGEGNDATGGLEIPKMEDVGNPSETEGSPAEPKTASDVVEEPTAEKPKEESKTEDKTTGLEIPKM